MIIWPNRVWEPSDNGWYSRPVTSEDIARRKMVEEALRENKLRDTDFESKPIQRP